MIRWLLAFATALILGAALWPIRNYRGDLTGTDEILAYELSAPRGVTVLVAGGTDEIVVTSWLIVPKQKAHVPAEKYSYEVNATITLASGKPFLERRFEIGSRISGDPAEPIAKGRFAARLAESDEWVTDGRTTRLNVSDLGTRAGVMRVWAPPTPGAIVLVRLSYEEPRGSVQRAIVERTLLPDQRRRAMGNSSALGFADLPAAAREKVLATWGRRLTAEGRSGRDFTVRRLLIGSYRAEAESEDTGVGFDVGPNQKAILNLAGRADLAVAGTPGTRVLLDDDSLPAAPQSLGATGWLHYSLRAERPRSVTLWTETPTRLRFWLPTQARNKLLGKPNVVEGAGQLEVVPDTRAQRYWRLDPEQPLRFEIAEGQEHFGVVLRGTGEVGATRARLSASMSWDGVPPSPDPTRLEGILPVTGLVAAPGASVSEPERALVIAPQGAKAMLLTGSESTLVSAWVPEPFVQSSLADPAYPSDLGEGRAWRDAPYEQRATATVLPERSFELIKAGRALSIRLEPHIVDVGGGTGNPIAERVLEPDGRYTSRRIYRTAWYTAGRDFPDNAAVLIADQTEKLIAVGVSGDSDSEFTLAFRTCAEQLDRTLTVLLDGEPVTKRRLRRTTGQLRVRAAPGKHRLGINGLGACGSALASVAPAASAPVLKRQTVYELVANRPLRIPFVRQPGELMSLSIIIVSEGRALPYRVSYAIPEKGERRRSGVFLRRITDLEGTLLGTTGGQERTNLWDSNAPLSDTGGADFLAKERIPLGDDLATGEHHLVLRSTSNSPLWVRAIVTGQTLDELGSTQP